jgi:hypothetical protein
MNRMLLLVTLGFVGLLCAASMGVAAYFVSRSSVGLPVTKLRPAPNELAPASTARPRPRTTPTVTTRTTPTTTTDDHGGSGGGGGGDDHGGGSGNSGHGGGGGGHGGDD